MTVAADSSPLVIPSKLGCFDLLNLLFPRLYISAEVRDEIVLAGAGLPGASEVSQAEWIEVKALQNPSGLCSAQRKYGLGPGEMSTILLAKELGANPLLLDDYRPRKLAKAEGLEILGTVGLLEAFYLRRRIWTFVTGAGGNESWPRTDCQMTRFNSASGARSGWEKSHRMDSFAPGVPGAFISVRRMLGWSAT